MVWEDEIAKLRQELDKIDQDLLELLAVRMGIVGKVKDLKRRYRQTPYQKERWNEVLTKLEVGSQKLGLNEDFVKDIWNRIHTEALDLERS